MLEKDSLEQLVKKAVAEVWEGHLAQAENELVARVLSEVQPLLGGTAEVGPADLLKAVSAIQSGSTQREILRTLLENASPYAGRVALFVIKAGAATGWQGRGFANSDEIKDCPLDAGSGLAAQALQSRIPATGPSEQVDHSFISRFHAPADGKVMLLPLLLKEKVAALVYADAGIDGGGKMDAASLELLVITTSAWLEVMALRKQAAKEGTAEAPSIEKSSEKTSSAPSQAPSFSDPFAAHSPAYMAPAPSTPSVEAAQAVTVASVVAEAEPVSVAASPAAVAVAAAPDALAGLSPEDAEVHRKAQRFARLLVDEIKLYNQAKVAEGRKNCDLYDRLKDDIDKSLATYQKRYGNSVAASAGYFNGELVRSLAEDDISVMGANFQR